MRISRGLLLLISSLFLAATARADDNCPCPPVKFMVYPIARVTFPLDQNASGSFIGAYKDAQNSGDWLEASLVKQQTDEFRVYGADLQPGAEGGNTAASPDNTTPNDAVDYDSWVNVSRSGTAPNYTYTVEVTVRDTRGGETVTSKSATLTDLEQVDATIDQILSGWGPMIDVIRNYQKKLRSQSNFEKLIYAHWTLEPTQTSLDIHESTPVRLRLVDCDGTPIPSREVTLKVLEPSLGSLSPPLVVTDANGEATAHFTAAGKSGVAHLEAVFIFSTVTHKDNNYATKCGGHDAIAIGVPYMMSVTIGFRERGEGEPPGWVEYHISGDGPMAFRPTPDAPNGKWIFLDDSGLTFNHIAFSCSAPCIYAGPPTFCSPAWIKSDGGTLVLHLDRLGAAHETYECEGHTATGGPGADAILLGLYNNSHFGEDENIMAGGGKIDRLKQLAAQVQADKAAGKTQAQMAQDYQNLMSAVHSQPMQPNELPGLTFNFPLPALDPNATSVLDYTVPLDPAPQPKADLIFSNLQIQIRKMK